MKQASLCNLELWRLIQESNWKDAEAFLLRKNNTSPAKKSFKCCDNVPSWSPPTSKVIVPNLLLASLEKCAPSKFVSMLLHSDKTLTCDDEDRSDGCAALALHLAIQNRYTLDIIKTIVLDCAPKSIETPTADGKLPLYWSILCSRECEIVLFLLECNRNAAAVPLPQSRYLPIHAATFRKYSLEVIQSLVEAYPKGLKTSIEFSNHLPLHLAIQSKADASVIRYLVGQYSAAAAAKTSDGSLPIHLLLMDPVMAQNGMLECLVEVCPGSLKVGDGKMRSPLHLALETKLDYSIIEYILEKGDTSLLNISCQDGNFPIHCAVSRKCPLIVIRLVAKDNLDCLNKPNSKGQLPLHIAVEMKCDIEVIDFLIERNKQAAAIKAKGGEYLLFEAISYDYPFEVIKSLVSAFPDVLKMTNSKGEYPLHVAIKRNDMSCAMLFLSMFQNSAAFKVGNELALHMAIEYCVSTELICALLLSFPRSIHITSNGKFPRDLTSFSSEPLILIALEKPVSYWALNAHQIKSKSLMDVAADVMNDLEVNGVATPNKHVDEHFVKQIVTEALTKMKKGEEQHRKETIQCVERSMELLRNDIRKEVLAGFEPILSCLDTMSKELDNIRTELKSDAANKLSAEDVLQRVEAEFGGELQNLKAAVTARLDALEDSMPDTSSSSNSFETSCEDY